MTKAERRQRELALVRSHAEILRVMTGTRSRSTPIELPCVASKRTTAMRRRKRLNRSSRVCLHRTRATGSWRRWAGRRAKGSAPIGPVDRLLSHRGHIKDELALEASSKFCIIGGRTASCGRAAGWFRSNAKLPRKLPGNFLTDACLQFWHGVEFGSALEFPRAPSGLSFRPAGNRLVSGDRRRQQGYRRRLIW